jgi:hypothetical protein
LNITSIADLRSQILENDGEEAIRLTAGDGNELNFYTNGTTASELRLQITDATTTINNTIEADDIKVDNSNKIICNTYGYRDDNTNPTYLSFDSQHAHITAPSGLMLNGSFNITNGNHGEITTTNGNKNLYYKTHGTGTHTFYVNTTTQVLELDNTDTTISSTNLKTNNIVSNTDNTYSIGTSTNKYVKIYGDEVIGRYLRSNYDTILNTFNEIEQFYRSFPTPIDIMNFTFSKTELTSGNTLMSIDGVADKVITYAKLELHDDLLLNSNIDLASLTTPFLNGYMENLYVRENRVFGGFGAGAGAYIDLRPTNYTTTAQALYNCPPIYFNNGDVTISTNQSDLRKSAIIGSPISAYLPSGELNTNSRNNIVFCCRTLGDNQVVDITDEKFRVGQLANYSSVDILPRGTCNLGKSTERWNYVHTDNLAVVDTINSGTIFSGTIKNQSYKGTEDTRFAGTTAYVDLRGVDYDVDGEGTNTPPIYFNTGYNAVFGDYSLTRKSMIIGSGVSLPTGETNSFSRNNIVFCVNNDSDNTISVSTSDERFRIGQVANYTSVNILPRNASCDLGSSASKFNIVYPTKIDFLSSLGDKILLYGTSYKIGMSQNSIDYTTDNTHAFKVGNTQKMRIAGNIVASTNVIPNSDNTYDLGNSNNKWKEIYAGNNVINTSDRTQKKEIDYQNIDQYADELLKLKPCSYKFIDGTSNRPHTGLVAQDLEGTMFELSGAYIKDRKKKTIIEDGITKEVDDEGFNYGLRYGELISPMLRLLQKQQEQIQKQEEQIQKQQEQINQLIKKVELLEKDEPIDNLSFI